MSHVVTIATEVRDPAAVAAACRRLGLPEPTFGTARLYSGDVVGLLVRLPGWVYPVAAETATGRLRFDDYGGVWGDQVQLDRLLQAYAVEKARIEARRRGHSVVEKTLADGSILLTVAVGGGS